MTYIVASVLSLVQHLSTLKDHPENYYLNQCPYADCGKSGLWRHGFRYRKSDREVQATLNPIPIPRLYCSTCKRTCSVLPECIPPLRWYLWMVQQAVMQLYFAGQSFNHISQQVTPSRWTISRWIKRLKERWGEWSIHLKARWSWLGYYTTCCDFWSALLDKIRLSQAMVYLNHHHVCIP